MAVYANLSIDQGTTFDSIISVEGTNALPFDLSSYSVRGQIRKSYTSVTYTAFSASIVDAELGQIGLALTSTQTAALKAGRYLYDVEVVHSITGAVIRVLEGQVEINPRITRIS